MKRAWVLLVVVASICGVGTTRVEATTSPAPLALTHRNVLRVIDADGSNPRQLTTSWGGSYGGLDWSRDGTRLAYLRAQSVSTTNVAFDEIVVNDASLRHERVVLSEPGLIHSDLTFSPDGRRIAYVAGYPAGFFGIGYQAHVWVMDADGSHRRLVAALPGSARWLDWAPTGGQLAFGVDGAETGAGLAIVDVDAAVPTPKIITPPDMVAVRGPAWSPDGRTIAFGGSRGDLLTTQLFVVKPDGTGLRRVSRATVGYSLGGPVWSPTGRSIAFTTAGWEIRIVHPDGTADRRVAEGRSPSWAPDARALAFTTSPRYGSTDASQLRILDLATGDVRRVVGADGLPIDADGMVAWAPR